MIMSEAKKWKVTVYEQDWSAKATKKKAISGDSIGNWSFLYPSHNRLIDQYSGMQITQNNTFVAHEWMTNMSIAAQQNNLHIQWVTLILVFFSDDIVWVFVESIINLIFYFLVVLSLCRCLTHTHRLS